MADKKKKEKSGENASGMKCIKGRKNNEKSNHVWNI